MKIILIFPRYEHGSATYKDKESWTSNVYSYPELTLPYIAALTPREHTVEIIDESHEDIDYNQKVDLVGISCFTTLAPRVYQIADEFRRRGIKVVLGGWHPTALPEEAKQHADTVVIGEAELIWPELLHDLSKNKLKSFYKSEKEFDMSIMPPARRDLLKHMTFLGSVISSKGCIYRCEFCAITNSPYHKVRHRPIKNVVEEIRNIPNKVFYFHDPSLTNDPKYTRELFKELIQQKIHKTWIANGNVNELLKIDDEFLNLSQKAGCTEWFVGFESINQAALRGCNKTINKVEDFPRIIKRIHKHGMLVQGGFIFGFDEDTPDIFNATLEKLNAWGIDIAPVSILTPYPGTPLYDRLEREQRITSKEWSRYNQAEVVFKPKNMSENELFEGTRKVAKEFYSMPNVLSRAAKVMMTCKHPTGWTTIISNFANRRHYKGDYNF
jgi:radical SAM superfamily enzyme YgiQ (UPF0313 family)